MSPSPSPGKRRASESPTATFKKSKCTSSSMNVNHRHFGTLLVNENIVDIFVLLRRHVLDDAQLVSVRFNAVISQRLISSCLRKIQGARLEMTPSKAGEAAGEYVAICVMSYKLDVAKTIPTHTSDEAEAVGILLNACRSAVVGCICLSGQDPLGTRFLEELVTYGPSMSAYSISFRKRRLADHVPKGLVLQAIGTLKNVGRISALPATEWKDENLAVLRFCAEIGIPVNFSGDIGVSDDELLQFLFEGKETRMDIDVHSSRLSDQFFKRLLQMAQQNPIAPGMFRQSDVKLLKPQDRSGTELHFRGRYHGTDSFKSIDGGRWILRLSEQRVFFTQVPL